MYFIGNIPAPFRYLLSETSSHLGFFSTGSRTEAFVARLVSVLPKGCWLLPGVRFLLSVLIALTFLSFSRTSLLLLRVITEGMGCDDILLKLLFPTISYGKGWSTGSQSRLVDRVDTVRGREVPNRSLSSIHPISTGLDKIQ